MKCVLLVVCVALASVNAKPTEEVVSESARIKRIESECFEQEHITDHDILEKFYAEKTEFPKAADLKCFSKCFLVKYGIMKDSGDFDLDSLKKMYPDQHHGVIEVCSKVTGSDACDKAYQFHKCCTHYH